MKRVAACKKVTLRTKSLLIGSAGGGYLEKKSSRRPTHISNICGSPASGRFARSYDTYLLLLLYKNALSTLLIYKVSLATTAQTSDYAHSNFTWSIYRGTRMASPGTVIGWLV